MPIAVIAHGQTRDGRKLFRVFGCSKGGFVTLDGLLRSFLLMRDTDRGPEITIVVGLQSHFWMDTSVYESQYT